MNLPTYDDVLAARATIAPHLSPTPLRQYQPLSDSARAEIWIKHENHLPTGAFKIRGGINFMARFAREHRNTPVLTASSGNHGQSIACAARLFGVRAVVVVPNGANPVKLEAIRGYGAEVRCVGKDFDDCRAYVEETAEKEGMHYLSSGDEPLLISGVATHTVEILEQQPDLDAIVVPVGGGSGAAGASLAAKAINSRIEVIGVQSERAPAAYRSWKERRRVEAPMETFAEGLATRAPFELTQAVMRENLADFVLVSDQELRRAMLILLEKTRNLVEGAGAAGLACVLRYPERFRGKRVALIVSGGNVSPEGLLQLLHDLM